MGKTRKKTHQEFIIEMQTKHPNLTILNEYHNSQTRIKYICNKCGLTWNATASKLSLGRGCPQCAGNKLKGHSEFIKQVKEINPNIEVVSQYKSTAYKILFKCKVCGYEWYTKPGDILKGKGCYICGKKNMCQKRTSLKGGHGCPSCKLSKEEMAIRNVLEFYNITFISQYKFKDLFGVGGGQLSYDFYLPKYNLLIEYQGKQHKQPIEYFGGEETFKIQKEHDKRKREYAFQHNIKLLEIWYYENINDKLKKTLNLETVTTTGC